jgi:hypothetical protein
VPESVCSRVAGLGVRWLVSLSLVCVLSAPLRAEEPMPSEYEVKADWLLNCARFVDWPGRSFADGQSPFVIGVVGKDPFGKHLDKAFEGKVVKGRAFIVRRLSVDQDLRYCHILFVSTSERKRTRVLLARLKGAPVLTVGETDDFLDQGGMVQFVRKGETIRFTVNLEPAQPACVYLSANLLKVAVSVRGKYE